MSKFWSFDLSKETVDQGPIIITILSVLVISSFEVVEKWLSAHQLFLSVLLGIAILFIWLRNRMVKPAGNES